MNLKALCLLIFLITACTTFKPNPDSAPRPAENGVFTLSVSACGVQGFGTVACLLNSVDSLTEKYIEVKIPATNTQKKQSSLNIVSKECRVNKTIPVQGIVRLQLSELLGMNTFENNNSCALYLTLSPTWQDQEKLTVATYPMTGRVLLIPSKNTSATIHANKGLPFKNIGFDRTTEKIVGLNVDPGNSTEGKILLWGSGTECVGFNTAVKYTSTPQILTLPPFSTPCLLLGSVLRPDVSTNLGFVLSIEPYPAKYLTLREPTIVNNELVFDEAISAAEINDKTYFGNKVKMDKKWGDLELNVMQYTVGGRVQWTFIKNNKIEWNIQ